MDSPWMVHLMRLHYALPFALLSLLSGCTDSSSDALADVADVQPLGSEEAGSDDASLQPDPAVGQTASKDFVLVGPIPDSIKFHFAGGSLKPRAEGIAMATVNFGVWGVGSCAKPSGNVLTSVVVLGSNQFGCGAVPAGDYELSFGIDAGEAVGKIVIPNATLIE